MCQMGQPLRGRLLFDIFFLPKIHENEVLAERDPSPPTFWSRSFVCHVNKQNKTDVWNWTLWWVDQCTKMLPAFFSGTETTWKNVDSGPQPRLSLPHSIPFNHKEGWNVQWGNGYYKIRFRSCALMWCVELSAYYRYGLEVVPLCDMWSYLLTTDGNS